MIAGAPPIKPVFGMWGSDSAWPRMYPFSREDGEVVQSCFRGGSAK